MDGCILSGLKLSGHMYYFPRTSTLFLKGIANSCRARISACFFYGYAPVVEALARIALRIRE